MTTNIMIPISQTTHTVTIDMRLLSVLVLVVTMIALAVYWVCIRPNQEPRRSQYMLSARLKVRGFE